MNIGIPELVILILAVLGLGRHFIHHGKTYNRPAFEVIPRVAIKTGLYAWGGFFATFGAPQIIYVVLYGLATLGSLGLIAERKPIEVDFNVFNGGIIITGHLLLLYWGGFFA